jgi:AbiV family abortive infection protein
MARMLAQYKGRLTPQQAADGINEARGNAERLYADAAVLFEQKRFESACALAILSIEEFGKPAILRRVATATTD